MKLKHLKSQLTFNRSERVGILLLIAIILGLLYVRFFVSFSEETTFDISSSELVQLQEQMDSLRRTEVARRKPKVYPFNPNFMSDYKAYTLGISAEAYDRLQAYRAEGRWINSVADFQRVTRVPDSVLAPIQGYFKFPDWVMNPRPRKKRFTSISSEISVAKKIDLNKATAGELQEVSGIGEALSSRILEQRAQLGGFSHDLQLHAVWGLKPEVVERVLQRFTVKTPKAIHRMNINRCSASDLATIPGVSFGLGKKIWEFVRIREGVSDLSELEKIEGISSRKLQLFALYLYAE